MNEHDALKEKGCAPLGYGLTDLEALQRDSELNHIWMGKHEVTYEYHLLPLNRAPSVGGTAIKSFYEKLPTNPESPQEQRRSWIGKMGMSKSMNGSSRQTYSSWGTINEREINDESVLEKVANDLYRVLSLGYFAVPKVRLSRQSLLDHYTLHNEIVKIYANTPDAIVKGVEGQRSIEGSVRVMSKFVTGYLNLADLKTQEGSDGEPLWALGHDEEDGWVEGFMELNGAPPETVIDPETGASVRLVGLMSVLSVGTSLADTDVLGGGGENCGVVFLTSQTGVRYAQVVKIDPGLSFTYRNDSNPRQPSENRRDNTRRREVRCGARFQMDDERDIQYGNQVGECSWEALSQDQRYEYLELKRHALHLSTDDAYWDYVYHRAGGFDRNEVERMDEEKSQAHRARLQDYLGEEAQTYQEDLAEYEIHRARWLFEQGCRAFREGRYTHGAMQLQAVLRCVEANQAQGVLEEDRQLAHTLLDLFERQAGDQMLELRTQMDTLASERITLQEAIQGLLDVNADLSEEKQALLIQLEEAQAATELALEEKTIELEALKFKVKQAVEHLRSDITEKEGVIEEQIQQVSELRQQLSESRRYASRETERAERTLSEKDNLSLRNQDLNRRIESLESDNLTKEGEHREEVGEIRAQLQRLEAQLNRSMDQKNEAPRRETRSEKPRRKTTTPSPFFETLTPKKKRANPQQTLQLIEAAKDGDLDRVAGLIDQGADPCQPGPNSEACAFMTAINHLQYDVVYFLEPVTRIDEGFNLGEFNLGRMTLGKNPERLWWETLRGQDMLDERIMIRTDIIKITRDKYGDVTALDFKRVTGRRGNREETMHDYGREIHCRKYRASSPQPTMGWERNDQILRSCVEEYNNFIEWLEARQAEVSSPNTGRYE